ncbi:MAG: radical SAM family heme chaperone HemW [Candidatus Omnitrophica bacterium]|nr:radical SAM family heme chaperone HemW [Candidatus Omnitrophota bacterium]
MINMDKFKMKYRKRITPWYFYPPIGVLGSNREEINLRERSELQDSSSLYVHIPFCASICTYCGFYRTISLKKEKLLEAYLIALEKEIVMYAKTPYVKSLKFGAVYFGGGTPSVLSSTQLERLLEICKREFNLSDNAQITIEGNSSSLDETKLSKILLKGFNRLSLGVQTFNDAIGKSLNLPHSWHQAIKIIEQARNIGYRNISIDLMYNLPGETLEIWEDDLKKAIALGVDHVTVFFLSVLPNTLLEQQLKDNRILPIGSRDKEIKMYELAIKTLTGAGYLQERLTDFVKSEVEGWVYGRLRAACTDVVGLGAGAFGYLNHYLYHNLRSIDGYINAVKDRQFPINISKKISVVEEMHGFMAVGLRDLKVNKQKFKKRFGLEAQDVFYDTLNRLESKGWIELTDEEIRLSYLGMLWAVEVCREFYSPEVRTLLGKIGCNKTKDFWKDKLSRLIKRIGSY